MNVSLKRASPRIAVIGAGMAGLTCAQRLAAAGVDAIVFEKSRGIGGRLATRRAPGGLRFDHGAQYVTARSSSFRMRIDEALKSGAAQIWRPELNIEGANAADDWFVGAPSMNAFLKRSATRLDIRLGTAVTALRREDDGWTVETAPPDAHGVFDAVVSAAPAPQTASLAVTAAPDLAERLERVEMAPCWAAMMCFETPYEPGFDIWRAEHDNLAWFARNASKPGRDRDADCWVAHAGVAWSAHYLEEPKEDVLEPMLALLRGALSGPMPALAFADCHRWRYARARVPFDAPFVADKTGTFLAAGDWCLGARVECAFESGDAAANALLSRISRI